MDNNGGSHSFDAEDLTNNKEWTYAFKGYAFVVGFLPENGVVRINRLKDNTEEDNNVLSTSIHPLSKKLATCINGFDNQLFYGDEAASGDGRFFTKDEDASVIVAFFDSPSKAIKIFKDIVVSYNNTDEFLSINDGSIVKLFNREPEDVVTFDVDNKFRLDLSKGNSYYRLNLYPPGGIYGSWDDLNEDEFNGEIPKVQFSQFAQELKTKPIDIHNMNDENITNEEAERQEKEAFLEESVISPDEVTPASNQSRKSSNSFFWNLLWVLLAIFMISLLFRQCNPNQNYFEKGVNYFDEGKSNKGFKYLDKAIKNDNQHIDALMRRGIEYMNAEEYQNAEYDFSEVIALDPNNWEAYYLRGRSYMEQAHNKWSPSYKKAIDDFTTSIGLKSSSLNADSYYLRGEAKEVSQGEKAGCADFSAACDLGHKEGCFRYDDLCYPETGYMPYKKYFGEGLFTGENWIYLDNTQSTTDALVIVRDINTGVKVRSQFIRKGEDITMNNIPNGNFEIKSFTGNNWAYDTMMPDGRTLGGFKINQEIQLNKKRLSCFYCEYSMTLYNVEGGNVIPEDIDFNEFMQ
jgi:tetratricopeptide (TPR) repeat protein